MLKKLADSEKIKLVYLDEAGFSGDLPVNYSWIKKGVQKHIPQTNRSSTKINVLGLFDYKKQKLTFSTTSQKMNSEIFISLFEKIKPKKTKIPVCVVLDNHSIHKSKLTTKKKLEWQKQNIFFFHNTPNSPELNIIEGQWRKLKHNCIRKRYFNNPQDLKKTIKKEIKTMNSKP